MISNLGREPLVFWMEFAPEEMRQLVAALADRDRPLIVMGDFNSRRGRVLGMEQRHNRTVIRATVPQAEILRYGTDLRSMTQGKAEFTMEFSRYLEVPASIAQEMIERANALCPPNPA